MNSEPRQLPTIKIHDTEFHVDIRLMEFRQVSNSDNVISFKNVQDNIDHTAVLYDPKTKNAFQGTWQEMSARKDVVLVKLPCIIDLDRDGLVAQLNQVSLDAHMKRQQANEAINESGSPIDYHAKRRRKGRGI